ncbi:AraC family transcriptional regulator [Pseudacidovorax intermedius]|uniref:AraC family transcriptional regulator n=1 Tax=Pseudacidovorax intermedius TaxID=433924 RepID=A0A147H781_9BURK|nr:AraC family transcriptional regulator [Pseudacidovorax intermedius]KTT25739.1 AraC family transcriptional regulator [Pseudacidovorax intermedius]
MKTSRAETRYRERVARVVAHIVAHPMAEHRLDALAAMAHFSPWHFHRIYASVTGESVAATVRRLRLAQAARLLQDGTRSVTEVALATGYDSPQAFSRAFSQFSGQPPSAFQQAMHRLAMGDDAGGGFSADPAEPKEARASSSAVQIVERPAQQVLALRHQGPAAMIPHTQRRLHLLLGEAPGTVWLGMVCDDPDDPQAGLIYHAAAAPAKLGPSGHSELQALTIPAGRYARHRLAGPYTRIGAAFDALYARWLPASGFEPDDRLALEHYLNSPRNAAPADLRTDLFIPIRTAVDQ